MSYLEERLSALVCLMGIKSARGTKDILPDEVGFYQEIERRSCLIFELCGYREIRTPLFEESQLFVRSLGRNSEIVQKQMFSVVSKGEKSWVLRPEATAPIIRAYLEHNLYKKSSFNKFYYIGPMFRAERPQKGRLRQFHHIGCEALGSLSPYLDAEVISLCINILQNLQIKQYNLKINNLGCEKDKQILSRLLGEKLKSKLTCLCISCKQRFRRNILRILDCKNDGCIQVLRDLDLGGEYLCKDCRGHFEKLTQALDILDIKYKVEPFLVRGLDYYNKTVFEITHPRLGSQDAIAAGGRYDNLASEFKDIEIPAVGFAIGLERLILSLDEASKQSLMQPYGVDVYIAPLGDEAYIQGFVMLDRLRKQKISSEIDYGAKSLKSQMRAANKLGVKFVVFIGQEEIVANSVTLKDMHTGHQEKISLGNFYKEISEKVNNTQIGKQIKIE